MTLAQSWKQRLPQVAAGLAVAFFASSVAADEFRSAWPKGVARTWIGPECYANRLQDWRIADGRLDCVKASARRPMRVAHLLTGALRDPPGELTMRVLTGPLEPNRKPNPAAWSGFLIGAGGKDIDYRLTALVHHLPARDGGLVAAIDGTGRVAFRDNEYKSAPGNRWTTAGKLHPQELKEIPVATRQGSGYGDTPLEQVDLELTVKPAGDRYVLTLTARDPVGGQLISQATLENVQPRLVDGGIGLVSHLGPLGSRLGHWFRHWQIAGSKLVAHPDRAFGPIICTQYTLSRRTLRMTAQMPPLGPEDTQTAELQIGTEGGEWRRVATGRLVEHSYTIPFRVEGWDARRDTPYRVVYKLRTDGGRTRTCHWSGTIREEPVTRDTLVVAAFTGTKHLTGGLREWNHSSVWFPHDELVAAVGQHDPDLLFFSGDQVYEFDLTGTQRQPLEKAMLDYHDKWYRWCWTFRELTRDRPCITIPDDHDVYQGNIWGAGGRPAKNQDNGGYVMPPEFVNMVQRTQTSHLPAPYDPAPVEQGIGVYYTSVEYAGVSFAVIEDRKFKSSPTAMIPEGRVVNGRFQNPDFDPATQANVPGAVLLGERQLKFLRDWAVDFSGGTWMKVVLSQAVFACVSTEPEGVEGARAVPRHQHPKPGEYPSGDKLAADADSNGWPQSGRNRALRAMRRGFALHIAGDRHLGSLLHYGVDEWDDAGFALSVPSVANASPRRWCPPQPGRNHREGMPRYTGQYRDGFGNRIHVQAVSNPVASGHDPARLHDAAPGYGIVRFNRPRRETVIECWPRWVDPSQPGAKQYPGWPVTVSQLDNYGRKAEAHLPPIEVSGTTDPVIRVVDKADGEIVYALRIAGRSFRPRVFHAGRYSVEVGEPGTSRWKTISNLQASTEPQPAVKVGF